MIVILTFFTVFLTIMAIKIKRVVWKEDKVLPCVLFFMTGSLILYFMYFVVEIAVYSIPKWQVLNAQSYLYAYMYTYYSAVLLLAIGAVLNVHKWI